MPGASCAGSCKRRGDRGIIYCIVDCTVGLQGQGMLVESRSPGHRAEGDGGKGNQTS